MTLNHKELLPAIILHAVGPEFAVVSPEELHNELQQSWQGSYTSEDLLLSLKDMRAHGPVAFLDEDDPTQPCRINGAIFRAVFLDHKRREDSPSMFNYINFGEVWLRGEWLKGDDLNGPSEKPDNDEKAEPEKIIQSKLTDAERKRVISLLDQAEEALAGSEASQHDRSQARAYIIAARALLEAPEPDEKLAWELVQRANALAGIASLLVSIVAIFLA